MQNNRNVGRLPCYRQGLGDTDVKHVLHQSIPLRDVRNIGNLLTGSSGQALALSYGALHLAVCPSVRPQSMSIVARWLDLPARYLLDSTGLYGIRMSPMTNLLPVHSRFLRHWDLTELLKAHRWLQHWIVDSVACFFPCL